MRNYECGKVQGKAMVALLVTTNKTRVSLYVEEWLKVRLDQLAKVRRRSLSNLIEVICEDAVLRAEETGELEKTISDRD